MSFRAKGTKRFRFRLRFKIAQRGMLKCAEKPVKRITFDRAGVSITFQAVHLDDINAADTFELSMGGF